MGKRYSIGIDLSRYRGKYVAIIDKKVVASGTDAKEVWAKVKKKYPSKTPELAKVSKEETLVLRREISEVKGLLITEPELRKKAVKRINEARGRIRKSYVAHEKMTKEFLR